MIGEVSVSIKKSSIDIEFPVSENIGIDLKFSKKNNQNY